VNEAHLMVVDSSASRKVFMFQRSKYLICPLLHLLLQITASQDEQISYSQFPQQPLPRPKKKKSNEDAFEETKKFSTRPLLQ